MVDSHARVFTASFFFLAIVLISTEAWSVEVTTCGQNVIEGILIGDLDCTGHPGPAVIVQSGLNLAGFTLTGGNDVGVKCERSCTVMSNPAGGTITGAAGAAIAGNPGTSLGVRDTIVAANGFLTNAPAITDFDGVRMRNAAIRDNAADGVAVYSAPKPGRVIAVNSAIENNGAWGIYANVVKLRNSTVRGNAGKGIDATSVVLNGVSVSDNGQDGVYASSARLSGCDVSENGGYGVNAGARVKDSIFHGNAAWGLIFHVGALQRVTITDNGWGGVRTSGRPIIDSTFSGNRQDPACGATIACADIVAHIETPPNLVGTTTCETSHVYDTGIPGENWGVCSLD